MEEAEKVFQGRVMTVAKRFREPGNTDEEIKEMEAKKKRSVKKDLKAKQGQAHTLNINYLVDEMKLQTSSSAASVSSASNDSCSVANDTSPKTNESEITETLASEPNPEKV